VSVASSAVAMAEPRRAALSYGIFNICLYLADTLVHVPYNALLPSLSPDPKTRETIFSVTRVFNSLGVMFAGLAPVPLGMLMVDPACYSEAPKCTGCSIMPPMGGNIREFCGATNVTLTDCECARDCFAFCDIQGERRGFRTMGFVFAAIHLVGMILVMIFIQEPKEAELDLQGGFPCCYRPDASKACNRKRSLAPASAPGRDDSTVVVNPIPSTVAIPAAAPSPPVSVVDPSSEGAEEASEATPTEDVEELREPIAASINKTFRNKAFASLIVPWLLDMASVSLLGSMLTLYVTYAVRPTDPTVVPACQGDGVREVFGVTSKLWCQNDSAWLGMGLFALMIGQVGFVPVWRALTGPFGTRNTWLMFNLASAVTTGLFIFGGLGSPIKTVVFSFVNGIPMAASFLNDAIVAQVIDYDANLQQGERAEARFMLFQSFIPKIISIPASVLPLAILTAIGFVEPVDGLPQPQPRIVTDYIAAVFFGVPTILSLCSFAYKLKFPIRFTEQLDRIAYNNQVLSGEASGEHAEKQWLRDPLDPSLAGTVSRSEPWAARLFWCCPGSRGLTKDEARDKLRANTVSLLKIEKDQERAAMDKGPSSPPLPGLKVPVDDETTLRDQQIRLRREFEQSPVTASDGPAGFRFSRRAIDVPRLSVYERVKLTTEDRKAFFVFDHFSLEELGLWSRFGRQFLQEKLSASRRRLLVFTCFMALMAVLQVSAGMLNHAVFSWVPTLSMLSFGLGLGLSIRAHLKVKACQQLRSRMCRSPGRLELWTKANAMALQLDCLELELVPIGDRTATR
jgi:Na+/melibiose symporter-like transporter